MRWTAMISHKMRSPAFPPRRPSAILRYLVPALFLLVLFYYLNPPQDTPPSVPQTYIPPAVPIQNLSPSQLSHQGPSGKNSKTSTEHSAKEQHEVNQPRPITPQEPIVDSEPKKTAPTSGDTLEVDDSQKPTQAKTKGSHPIDRLIENADKQFSDVLLEQSHSIEEAAAAYRKRRGRHPPPGFDRWYAFATRNNAVMVESFWDQIYHDLEPFWALDALEIRKAAWEFEMTINVRKGKATAASDWFWTQIWLSMVQTISHLLPDMDIALNAMDEPRLVVPWEKMSEYMNKASASKGMVPAKDAVGSFEQLPLPGMGSDANVALPEKDWESTSKSVGSIRTPCWIGYLSIWHWSPILEDVTNDFLFSRALLENSQARLRA